MKRILFSLLVVLFATVAYSEQNKKSKIEKSIDKIEGVVVDAKTGEALVGVAIEINNKIIYTGFDGEFTLDSKDINSKQLSATLVSYKPATVDFKNVSKYFTISLEAE